VKTSRLAAVSLVAVPLVAFPYVNANDEAGGRFVFDTVRRGAIASAIEAHEQGVSKAGNRRLRTTMIQLAWLWLRHQPTSALSVWFQERVQSNGGKMRKTTIVALARKLLVALWKYSTSGVVIEGAVMKTI
jgi:Transposase IS116/IS110/IS902 family